MMQYKNLTELYNAHSDDPPDGIVELIREFFTGAGKYYRRGLLSEEEFCLMTHYGTIYNTLWGLKNDIHVNWKLF